jgi:hypothetical protein
VLLDLEQLPLDGSHPRHQPVELKQEILFVLPGLLDQFLRGAMMNPVERVCQLAVQRQHSLLQTYKLLTKLPFLDHREELSVRKSKACQSLTETYRNLHSEKSKTAAKLKHSLRVTVL